MQIAIFERMSLVAGNTETMNNFVPKINKNKVLSRSEINKSAFFQAIQEIL